MFVVVCTLLLCLLCPLWFIRVVGNRESVNAPYQQMVDKVPFLAAVLHLVLLPPVTVAVALLNVIMGSFSGHKWCCDATGEYEAALSLLLIAVPAYLWLMRSSLKLDSQLVNPFLEHIRHSFILYGFLFFQLYIYFTNIRGILDSGEPGRAIILAFIATTFIAIATNLIGVTFMRIRQLRVNR